MLKFKKLIAYFTITEYVILIISQAIILLSFFVFGGEDYLSLLTSLLGVISLILCAKGNPLGQFLVIIFGLIYAYISFTISYYGELITYGLMTVPMAILSLISWIRNPHKGNRAEVEVNQIPVREIPFLFVLACLVSLVMYPALKYLGTANLLISTVSVFTTFIAVYLTFRRSPYFALAYAVNDIVLVVLWVLASFEDASYVAVATCFAVFLINDIYGFFNWMRMRRRQVSE